MSLNKAMIIGNLGRDPEMRYTPGGQAVTQFTVAVNRNYKGKNDEWKEETEWFRVVVWGPLAERIAQRIHKGSKVYVEGRLQTRTWEDKDGQKRSTTELVAQTVTPLDPRPRGDAAPRGDSDDGDGAPAQSSSRPAPESDGSVSSDDLDELPF